MEGTSRSSEMVRKEKRPATDQVSGRNSTLLFRQLLDLENAVKKILQK